MDTFTFKNIAVGQKFYFVNKVSGKVLPNPVKYTKTTERPSPVKSTRLTNCNYVVKERLYYGMAQPNDAVVLA